MSNMLPLSNSHSELLVQEVKLNRLRLSSEVNKTRSAVQTPRLKVADLVVQLRCESTMADRELIHFDNSPTYRQQVTVLDLFRENMACGADCAAVGGDEAHWLGILSKTKNKDSGNLDQCKEERYITKVLAEVVLNAGYIPRTAHQRI